MEIPQFNDRWTPYLATVSQRFNRELGVQMMGEPDWILPPDLKSLAFWQACQHDHLNDRLSVPFYTLRQPKKREHCLDLGCGVSFLIYPWSQWDAFFHGHELSTRIVQMIQSRGSQLNSKLFKSMRQGAAHQLDAYDPESFDLAIATGFVYYYPIDYLAEIWQALKPVLKPKSQLILEVVNPDSKWADEWGLIEIFKGTEPILAPLTDWEKVIKQLQGRLVKRADGELFTTWLIQVS